MSNLRNDSCSSDYEGSVESVDNSTGKKISSLASALKQRTARAAQMAKEKTVELSLIAKEKTAEWRQKAIDAYSSANSGRKDIVSSPFNLTPTSSPTSNTKNIVFGVPVVDAVRSNKAPLPVPVVVHRCIAYLTTNGIDEVGIYRLSGSVTDVQHFKSLFGTGEDMDLAELNADPNAVASLLKMYFRDLPSSLLTNSLCPEFEAVLEDIADEFNFSTTFTVSNQLVQSLKAVADRLPAEHSSLCSVLFEHLADVASRCETNKMGIPNLQVVWTPTLRLSRNLFGMLVMLHKQLFTLNTLATANANQQSSSMASISSNTFTKKSPPSKPPSSKLSSYYNKQLPQLPPSHSLSQVSPAQPEVQQIFEKIYESIQTSELSKEPMFVPSQSSGVYLTNSNATEAPKKPPRSK